MVFSNSSIWLALFFSFVLHSFVLHSLVIFLLLVALSFTIEGETERLFAYSLFVSWIVFLILVT